MKILNLFRRFRKTTKPEPVVETAPVEKKATVEGEPLYLGKHIVEINVTILARARKRFPHKEHMTKTKVGGLEPAITKFGGLDPKIEPDNNVN